MKNLYQWALTLFAVILLLPLNSCSGGSGRSKVEYIPFRETKDGQWGMISPDGKVLFREEFDNEPTFAREGRFFVRNDKGLWEMYTTEAKPKKIGGEYTSASSFDNGSAVVVEADEPVKIIDTDGKTIKKLDKINNKVVELVNPLYSGLATFMTADSLIGALDSKGNCIVEPNYIALQRGNGFFLAVPAKYRKAYLENEGLKGVKVSVLDADGKEICQLSGDKYKNIRAVNDKIVASQEHDGKTVWSILDTKGNQLFKGGAKVDNILDVEGENFTYRNGEHVGLMNIKGETLIRAKYSDLTFDEDGLFIAKTQKGSEGYQCKIIDSEDKQVGSDTYSNLYQFRAFDGQHTIAEQNDNDYVLIDREGKVLPKLPDMVETGFSDGDYEIKSNYIDYTALFDALKLQTQGVDGVSVGEQASSVISRLAGKGLLTNGNDDHPASDPYWYDVRKLISYKKKVNGIEVQFMVVFDDYPSQGEFTNNGYQYAWNDAKTTACSAIFSNTDKLEGKTDHLYHILTKKFAALGKVLKENKGAKLFDLGNGKRVIVAHLKDEVGVIFCTAEIAQNFDYDKYSDYEEGTSNVEDSVSVGTPYDEEMGDEEDQITVDSAVVDY
jgi:putative lipoprotein